MNEQLGVCKLDQKRRELLDNFYTLLEGIDVNRDLDVLEQVVKNGSRFIIANSSRPRLVLRVIT